MSIELNGTTGIDFNDGSNQSTSATPYGRKNLIINGDMRIAQRGTSTSGITSGGTYPSIDRIRYALSTAGTWTHAQDTDVPTGQGFAYSNKLSCTTSTTLSAGSFIIWQHIIEGQNLQALKKGTANAEALTLSFWVKTNKTGTFTAELYDNDNTRSISQLFTISSADTWEKKTITFAGDTTGTIVSDNSAGMTMQLWLAAGSNFTSGTLATSWEASTAANRAVGQTINLADSTSNYINITGVQLEVGDAASDFEFMPYDMELQRCQRYCEVYEWGGASPNGHTLLANVWTASSKAKTTGISLKVIKRAAPTVTISGAGRYIATSGQHSAAGFTTTYITEDRIGINSNNTYAVGHGWMDAFQNVTIDAEL